METLETVGRGTPVRGPAQRRVKVAIRKVNPWSVLKFSLLFYLCLMLVFLVGFVILWGILDAAGIVRSVEQLLTEFWGAGDVATGPSDPVTPFEIDFWYVFRMMLVIGLASVVLWAALTMVVTFLYNLISDLVGGIEVTLVERR
jgi:Transmembrane domain of unknown function (DUF3566)